MLRLKRECHLANKCPLSRARTAAFGLVTVVTVLFGCQAPAGPGVLCRIQWVDEFGAIGEEHIKEQITVRQDRTFEWKAKKGWRKYFGTKEGQLTSDLFERLSTLVKQSSGAAAGKYPAFKSINGTPTHQHHVDGIILSDPKPIPEVWRVTSGCDSMVCRILQPHEKPDRYGRKTMSEVTVWTDKTYYRFETDEPGGISLDVTYHGDIPAAMFERLLEIVKSSERLTPVDGIPTCSLDSEGPRDGDPEVIAEVWHLAFGR